MSKGDGPAANSFDNPRKVGWLHKQGGSGVTSHWRKRWFVVHQNYLFYYKKPEDKSPVGILSLPDYDSCSKTEGKEWKKPNTFLLERGKDGESPDGPSKSYALYSDSEEEMLEWIKILEEEMKPTPGSGRHEANGRGPAPPSKSKVKPKPTADVKVDPKAFNELSELALETPKLTHLTAARPKVRNRRPPKRYAVFHEDDSKEDTHDESPPPSPKPLPSPSPPPAKKGHRPSAPMVPKPKPLTPPKSRSATSISPDPAAAEGEQGSEVKKKAPPPPRKPSKERPLPPTKPSKANIEPKAEEPEYAVPVKKPRPTPPTKPRPSSVATPTETPTTPDAPVPKPRPRKRAVTSGEAIIEEASTPISGDTPVIKEEATPPFSPPPEEVVTNGDENIYDMVEANETIDSVAPSSTTKEDSPETDSKDEESNIADVSNKPADIESETEETVEEKPEPKDPTPEEVKPESNKTEPAEVIDVPKEDPSGDIESESKPTSETESLYEVMDMGEPGSGKNDSDSGSEYEPVDFEPIPEIKPIDRHSYEFVADPSSDATIEISVSEQDRQTPGPVETSSKGQSTSSYESMDPAVLGKEDKDEYIDMEGAVFEKDQIEGYDQPRQWLPSNSPLRMSEYDVPPPARPASGSLDRGSPGIVSSSGSTGSRGQRTDRLSTLRAGSIGSDRDRTPSAGSQGLSKPFTPPPSQVDSAQSVSGTLRQAKEILRLAHMVKVEADEDREMARRELELARRERHDAELLKKNAAQILKMAKERLNGSKTI